MAGHKPDQELPGDLGNFGQQIGKIDLFFQVFAVGVYILTQESDLLCTGFDNLAALSQNVLHFPAAFPTTDIGDDTVGAEIVAAIHNGNPSLQSLIPQLGQTFCNGAGLVFCKEHPFLSGKYPV